ncbi:MAG: hypothetical protein GPOALKHO_000609 [Sodalis sp.]|nr:MAG: hypothetical protein GPOALKHO_000609 [Sodalis sp.]
MMSTENASPLEMITHLSAMGISAKMDSLLPAQVLTISSLKRYQSTDLSIFIFMMSLR